MLDFRCLGAVYCCSAAGHSHAVAATAVAAAVTVAKAAADFDFLDAELCQTCGWWGAIGTTRRTYMLSLLQLRDSGEKMGRSVSQLLRTVLPEQQIIHLSCRCTCTGVFLRGSRRISNVIYGLVYSNVVVQARGPCT